MKDVLLNYGDWKGFNDCRVFFVFFLFCVIWFLEILFFFEKDGVMDCRINECILMLIFKLVSFWVSECLNRIVYMVYIGDLYGGWILNLEIIFELL